MAMRKHPMRFRAVQPMTENLEGRQLLSGVTTVPVPSLNRNNPALHTQVVSGVNTEGDAWSLKVVGPGTLHVIKQPDASGNATSLTSPSEIASITIAGTDPLQTRLVGTVKPSGRGDGRVFFQTFTEVANRRENGPGGNGLLSIDMPNFWLGLTAAAAPTTARTGEPAINIPDGTSTLRFGGVDTTAFFGTDPTKSLANNGQDDQLRVNLGLPQYGGTRVIIDKSISSATAGATSATGTAGTPTQDSVAFAVSGRLGIFQANEVDGNSAISPGFFATGSVSSPAGGTIVSSSPDQTSGVTGAIGDVRIGANATNFVVLTNDRIHSVFIGGETNTVSILAPAGSRDLLFGKGMDTTQILSHTIENLEANRGALNSSVIVDRQIGNIQFGGDVVNTTVQAGYDQSLATVFQNPTAARTSTAQVGGQIRATIAGNVTNSVFAASVMPDATGKFGSPDSFALPVGTIKARVEGTISNTTATPASPTTAFYAQKVIVTKGPVVPPNVPEAPFPGPITPRSLPGIPRPYVNFKIPRATRRS